MKNVGTTKYILAVVVIFTAILGLPSILSAHEPAFTESFRLQSCNGFSSTGINPYFILKPGHTLILEGEEEGQDVRLTITVLNDTETIQGITTRVVEERETHDGQLAEVSRNFFAICNRNNSVFYFGEDTDLYENGKIVSHEGAWRAGVNNARPGLMMSGTLLLGARYLQERAPGVALDRAEILSLSAIVQTPAGKFEHCLETEETTALEPGAKEFKFYASGIGIVQDDTLKLVEVITP
jgi:hypothetical protein